MRQLAILFLVCIAFLILQKGEAFVIQGHRGMRGALPENTLPAFEAAVHGEIDLIELDLLVTQDGEIIVYHDFFLNPALCAYKDGSPITGMLLIRNLSLAEVKNIDCGGRPHPQFPSQKLLPGITIPTLSELFSLLHYSDHPYAQKIKLNLELKICPMYPMATFPPATVVEKAVAAVEKGGLKERIYYSSFDIEALQKVRQLDPHATIGFIVNDRHLQEAWKVEPENWLPFVLQTAAENKIDIISPDYQLLDGEAVAALKKAGFSVIPWTVNIPADWERIMGLGVDGIITDYPLELKAYLKAKQGR